MYLQKVSQNWKKKTATVIHLTNEGMKSILHFKNKLT